MWVNFRASRDDNTIYWQVTEAKIDGPTCLNIEVPDPIVNSPAAVERLLAGTSQAELCGACDGATVGLQPWGGVGYHAENCAWYYGWTLRDAPWVPRNLTPEPTPETPTE
ncbi:hypothetical protein GCM10029976_091030 [Kribbella albertanoniae]|uniref:Uncharacterized protein n=1 Tax=Kribbella albertanoniae TaxID=1266829 RepID=A0A4V2XPK5_9ACTN|nr:hypothetical protein [Kribbella albertanoniae]TDC22455.1 hypothetical protein E1261_30895 [Kribbella albertanoniae]